jgi:hypothetical protein
MTRIDDMHGSPRPRPRSLLFRKRWLVLLGLAVLVLFAPQIVALTPLVQSAVDANAPELQGRLKVGSVSLSWFSPVAVRDIVWLDADGHTLAEIAAVRLERSAWQLLANSKDLGTIHVEQPHVTIALRDDGSNLEDALAPLLQPRETSKPLALALDVQDGVVEIIDSTRQLEWQIEKLDAQLILPGNADEPSQLAVKGQVHDSQGVGRPMDIAYDWHTPRAQPQAGEPGGTLKIKTAGTPLAMFRPLLRRYVAGAEFDGVMTCEAQLTYNADSSQQQLKLAQLEASDLVFSAPQFTGREALRSARLVATGDVQVANGRAKLNSVEVASDFAALSINGQLPVAGWEQNATGMALAVLQNEDYVVHGELDLAKVAALLPETLRLREGTEITAGKITLELASRNDGKRRYWDGALQSTQLVAQQNGREIAWDQPIALSLAAKQTATGMIIERLSCESSFLSAQARGTLDQGELSLSGDLAQLLAEANRFANLEDFRLAGKLGGNLGWRRENQTAFTADGQAEVTAFELTVPGQQPWREPRLTMQLLANGTADLNGLTRLDAARFQLVAGEDQLDAQLAEAVKSPSTVSIWPINIAARGELSRWLPRVRAFVPAAVEQAAGGAVLEAQVLSSQQAIELRQIKLDIANFTAQANGMTIREGEVHVTGDLAWDYTGQKLISNVLTVATSALAFRGDQLALQPRQNGVAVSGEIGYRAELSRASAWFDTPGHSANQQWQGMTAGRMKFTHDGTVTHAKWTAEFENLALARRRIAAAGVSPVAAPRSDWEIVWQEPKLTAAGQGDFDHARDRLIASNLSLASTALSATARGQIDAVTTKPVVDLTGELAYDLESIAAILATYIDGLKMSGTDKKQFVLRGPLPALATFASQDPRQPTVQKLVWPKQLVGRAGVGWTSAEMYGLPLGKGSLDATLENGIVDFAPLDVAVADGRLKAWPRIVLSNEPMVFQLAKGTQADQVQITPQMCQTWLKFVAPLLADATRAEGKFSATVEGATLPLLSPGYGDARGTLTVHGARVGPGPLAEQYVLLAHQVRAILERKPLDAGFKPSDVEWLTLSQQDVPVELNSGRVYHRGLQIMVRDTTLVSTGSVGVDQTIALLVEVPIRDEWVAKDRLLSGLRGQTLKIPIGGTVSQPQVDKRVLEQLAAQFINNAAGQLLENELQKGLDKLFRPK